MSPLTAPPPTVRLLIVAALAAFLLFPMLPTGGLAGYDDAVYAHEAKEMLRSGDWRSVYFDGVLNLEYPPLFLWIEAASMRAFGMSDFAAKLPAALAGFGAILAVYFLALELTGNLWASILAMFILTGSQFFLKYATHAMTDVPCTFFFTLALLLYAIGLRRPPYLALAGVPVAAAILTRSVIGIIPLGIMAVHMAAVGRGRLLRSPQWICACAIAVFPPLLWMASQYYFYGNYFLHEHFSFIAGKVAGEAATAPALSLRGFYYLGALLRFYWPWLPFLAIGLVVEVRAAVSRRDSAAILVLLWVLFIIGPFSLADTKYARYLLPAFPALAILSAAGVRRVVSQARLGIAFNVACLLLFLVAAGAVAFPSRERAADMRRLAPVAEAHSDPAERVLIYAGHDYENEFLWYSHRYSELVTDMDELKDRLVEGEKITGIIDRASFEALLKQLPPPCARKIERLADSQGFVCYRANHE